MDYEEINVERQIEANETSDSDSTVMKLIRAQKNKTD